MAIDRRAALLALSAAGAFPLAAFANPRGDARWVACARRPDGSFAAIVLDEDARPVRAEHLPARGHGAAVSPTTGTAVVFARRPGRFALALELSRERPPVAFAPPVDRHFYGHGMFSADGRLLFATENDFESERGVIGVYDAEAGFRRIGEFDTGGVGPHEALLLSDGRTIVVANGGIATHPDYPGLPLNLEAMSPTLAYLDAANGDILGLASLPRRLRRLSLRHMAEAGDGSVWFGGQYQGSPDGPVALVGTHSRERGIDLLAAPEGVYAGMRRYVGSMAASRDGALVVATSPRGGKCVIWDAEGRRVAAVRALPDVCGAAPAPVGFLLSDGFGGLHLAGSSAVPWDGFSWDNHLTAA